MMALNKYFDHTLLKPDATDGQIKTLCQEAREYDFYSVCINSCHVNLAAKELEMCIRDRHRIVNSHAGGYRTAGAIDVNTDIFIRVFCFQE